MDREELAEIVQNATHHDILLKGKVDPKEALSIADTAEILSRFFGTVLREVIRADY